MEKRHDAEAYRHRPLACTVIMPGEHVPNFPSGDSKFEARPIGRKRPTCRFVARLPIPAISPLLPQRPGRAWSVVEVHSPPPPVPCPVKAWLYSSFKCGPFRSSEIPIGPL